MNLREMLGPVPDKTPFARGVDAAKKGCRAPSLPTPDSSWAERLYARGYSSVTK
jgi:hypothetical protein